MFIKELLINSDKHFRVTLQPINVSWHKLLLLIPVLITG